MKKNTLVFVLTLLILLFSLDGCFLSSGSSTKETLPPATQTGANTFGCYVNGKVWLPKGYVGTHNLILNYDPTYAGGAFNLESYRIDNGYTQYITIGSDSVHKESTYYLSPKGRVAAFFSEFNSTTQAVVCDYTDYKIVERSGQLVLTKLDLQHGIVSGTFQFTLFKAGCDTIKVTEGRFDIKL